MDTSEISLEARLERGDIVTFDPCPFPLPEGEQRQFLYEQTLGGGRHKNISFNPFDRTLTGHEDDRLRDILERFGEQATRWLETALPWYAASWRRDRVSYRPEEEATRRLRWSARNDLLHIDAFPSRPTGGQRILRLFVNLHPTEPRVWATSDTFPRLLEQFGDKLRGTDLESWPRRLLSLFQPVEGERTPYDLFMLRLHHAMKANDRFQERAPKRFWHFPAGSAWLVFSDGVAHAELRGRYALEHSYFVPTEVLLHPEAAPVEMLRRKNTALQAA